MLRNGLIGATRLIVLSILAVPPLTAPVTGMKLRPLEIEFKPPATPAAQGAVARQEDR